MSACLDLLLADRTTEVDAEPDLPSCPLLTDEQMAAFDDMAGLEA
jgi:hypothetical protein